MSGSRTEIEVEPTGLLPEGEVQEDGTRAKTPREEIMDRIAANADLVRQREIAQAAIYDADAREAGLVYPPNDDGDGDAGAANPPLPTAAPAAKEPDPPAASPPPGSEPGPAQTFVVEVDGQHLTVTHEQMSALARMGVLANTALHQYRQGQQQPAPAPQAPAPQQTQQPAVEDAVVRDTVKRIQYGTEDDAAAALSTLIERVAAANRQPVAPPVDWVAVGNYAAQKAKVEARQEAQLTLDTEVIRREYADLFENPIRSDAASRQVAMIRQRNTALGQTQSDLDIFREAGNTVRQAFGIASQPSESGNEQAASQAAPGNIVVRSRGEVERRKREAPRSTSQVIDRRSQVPEGPRPPSAADVVELMRKQRGQTSMR